MTSSRATYEENVSFFLVIIITELLLRHRFRDQLGHCGLDRRIHPRFHHSNHRNFQRGSGSRDRHSFIVTSPRLSLCKLLPSRRCGICARQERHARVFQRTQKPNSLSTGAALTKPALWRISNRLASTRLRGKSSFALLFSTLFCRACALCALSAATCVCTGTVEAKAVQVHVGSRCLQQFCCVARRLTTTISQCVDQVKERIC